MHRISGFRDSDRPVK